MNRSSAARTRSSEPDRVLGLPVLGWEPVAVGVLLYCVWCLYAIVVAFLSSFEGPARLAAVAISVPLFAFGFFSELQQAILARRRNRPTADCGHDLV